jgi:hypothetical protein
VKRTVEREGRDRRRERRRTPARWARAWFFGVLLAGAAACGPAFEDSGSSDPNSCENVPDACDGDEVCWPNRAQDSFECLAVPAGAGGDGDLCVIQAGDPDCAHGLFCYTPSGGSDGVCSPRCDPAADSGVCSSGVCTRLHVGDLGVIGVCRSE